MEQPDKIDIQLIVNGQEVHKQVPPDLTLLRLLRDYLGLTGTKDGCSQGHCGTCTVIMDGKAVRSCLVQIDRAQGREILTIEGLSQDGELHPIQRAFITEGAIQCGFCTPGLVLATKVLLDHNPDPTDEEIRQALRWNICRCAGYSKILAAVRKAAQLMADPAAGADDISRGSTKPVGQSVVRKDAADKVSGRTQYAADMARPGMLHGKVLWSPVPHARILGLDTSVAEGMPGVRAVLTAADVPGAKRFGLITADQPVLASERVRFLGDALAVVYADTEDQAAAAVETIDVAYQELPLLLDPEEALAENAPRLHEDGNLVDHTTICVGDVVRGLADADVVIEGTYTTPQVEHAYLEPEAALGVADQEGGVTIWSGTHEPTKIQIQVAAALAVPEHQVRVVHVPTGGAFGSKHDVLLQIFTALGAVRTGRPVRMVLSRAESLRVHPKRHAFRMRYRTGARRDGMLTAMEATIIADAGAYASESMPVLRTAIGAACGAYHVPNIALDGYVAYTNNPTAGAMRGFGIPQVVFAVETQMDRLARALGMDPFELRLRNALDQGGTTSTGQILREPTAFPECLCTARAALARFDHLPPPRPGTQRGVGVAAGIKPTGLGYGRDPGAGAAVELTPAGELLVRVGGVELGQGLQTMAAQVAAQSLGIDYGYVQVLMGDTQETPAGGPTIASRQTYVTGSAIVEACTALRRRLLAYASEIYDVPQDTLLLQDGALVNLRSEDRLCTLWELAAFAQQRDWQLWERTHYMPPETVALGVCWEGPDGERIQGDTHFSLSFGVQVAVVDVDQKTGEVDVVKLILVHDVGKAIHPQNVELQLEGGAVMGMGYALSEQYQAYGPDATTNLRACRVPGIAQTPEMEIHLVEQQRMVGTSGGKAVGEVGVVPTAPAIANAIYDAVGVRVVDLPARPERIRAALNGR